MAEEFGSPNAQGVAEAGIPGDDDRLSELTEDWRRLKEQKAKKGGGIESRTLLNIAFVEDEQYTYYKERGLHLEKRDENKLYLVFNFIKKRLTKLLGRLCSINPPFLSRPLKDSPSARARAEVVDRLTLALDTKLDEEALTQQRWWWMLVGGTCFEYVTWVPNASTEPSPKEVDGEYIYRNMVTKEEIPESQAVQLIQAGAPPESFELVETAQPVGEVGDVVLGPLNVFIDQTVRSIKDLAPDQRVHIAQIKTVGWVKENFGVDVEPDEHFEIVTTRFTGGGDAVGGKFLQDLIPLVQGSADKHDPQMVTVVEAYQPPSDEFPRGRYTVYIPDKEILHDGENPYEEIPLVDFHFSPVTTSFWTSDYVTPLIAPQKFLNKRLSQLGEQSNATIYSNLLLGPGVKEQDIPADYPGVIEGGLNDSGQPNVRRLDPPQLPAWFMESINLAMGAFNDLAGAGDLMEKDKFPGQMRGPLAVPMLQEILDTEWGPLYKHYGEQVARVKQMRLNRVKVFYPPIRTLHYTDRNQKDEVLDFHTDEVLRSGTDYNVSVERSALVPELRALKEARLLERLNGPLAILYMDERTGRFDKSKIAKDLQFGDVGRETREGQYRKLGSEIVEMLWTGRPIPPVLPFYDHAVMMDELEASMATTEFLRASPQIQQLFMQRYEQHRQFMMMEAQAQQQAMMGGMVRNAVAQASQQAAAQAASETVMETRQQMKTNEQLPTEELVRSAAERSGEAPPEKSGGGPAIREIIMREKRDQGQ